LIGATSTGACRGVELFGTDSIGNAGLPNLFQYSWTTTTPTPSNEMANITAYINKLALVSITTGVPLRSIVIPPTLLQVNTSYGFQLTVTNWRGASSTSSVFVVYKTGVTQLEASVEGLDGRSVSASATFVAVASYNTASLCGLPISSVSYTWSQTDGPMVSSSAITGETIKTLVIAPYQLSPAASYSFSVVVVVTLSGGSIISTSASTSWVVGLSSLQPVIQGGNDRLVSLYQFDSNITIDASRSYDPDVYGNPARVGISYQWNCTIKSTGEGCVFIGLQQPNLTRSVLTIYKSQLSASLQATMIDTDAMIFTVIISKGSRSSRATISVVTTTSFAPSVALRPVDTTSPPAEQLQSSATAVRVAVSEPLTLRGQISPITSTTQLLWVCTSNNFDMSNSQLRLTPVTNADLVIAAGALDPGVTYTFELRAMDPTISNTTGRASVLVETNAPPTGGSCSSAGDSVMFNETVGISCYDWIDSPSDFPLEYRFGMQTENGLEVVVGFFQTAAAMSSFLPPGRRSLHGHDRCICLLYCLID
jgi:hypothetical protein